MSSSFPSPTELCTVFVCNIDFINKFIKTCHQLITFGKYHGDICLVIGDDLNQQLPQLLNHEFIKHNNIIIKYFPNIKFPDHFYNINNTVVTDDRRNIFKRFQWHKLHLFNSFFKRWQYLFYIDCGMNILSNIQPILHEKKVNKILAHSDAFPKYEWKLHNQFCRINVAYFSALEQKYNLNVDYFQSGVMLYDTNIIDEHTFDNLYKLSLEYPISKTNEQGIMALYFTNIKPLWEQIRIKNEQTYFYDYSKRYSDGDYIMVKCIL